MLRSTELGKAIIWDMDGVIADTGPFHFAAWREIVEGKGRKYTEADFQHGFGLRNEDILISLFDNLTPQEIDSLSRKKEETFRSKIEGNIRPLPGVLDLLDIQLEGGFGIALASSTPIENIELILNSLDIRGYFNCIVSADDVTRGKPHPEGFLLASQQLGITPSSCVVIEDATAGVEAAKAAGMKCIAVTNTHSPEALAKADLVTDNLERISGEDLHRLIIASKEDDDLRPGDIRD